MQKDRVVTKHMQINDKVADEVDTFLTPKVDVPKSMKANKIIFQKPQQQVLSEDHPIK